MTGSEKCGGVNQAKGIIRVLSVLVWLGEDALGASEFLLKAQIFVVLSRHRQRQLDRGKLLESLANVK
jgi:hypothetical protein